VLPELPSSLVKWISCVLAGMLALPFIELAQEIAASLVRKEHK